MKRHLLYLFMVVLSLSLGAQEYKQLTNLPTVYIETTNQTAVTTKKTFISGKWIQVDGDKTDTLTGLKIRCRGNSTFNNAGATKKAYRVKFDKKVALLGDKGVSDKNWVLMANHFDKSLIRNALSTDIMGRFAGLEFNPGALFVDVVLNGEYIGNYQITDHPDVESGRLDITTPGEDEEPSEGFFLEADGWKDHKYVTTTRQSVPVRIHKPKDGAVTTAQADYVKAWLDRFEDALFGKDFKDAEKGYRKLVDSTSLANLYVCTEMSANYDGFWSTYLYKRPNDQKMYFGPMWDYDIAYGNDTRWGDSSRKMVVDLNSGVCRSWFTRMWRDPWFRQLILRRYNELRAAGIEAYLQHAVDSLGELNAQSAKLNFDKYGINTKVYNENVLHATYEEYIADLKDFLTKHFAYLDEELTTRANATYDDEAREFELNINYFYRIQSVGVKTLFDVTNEALTEGSLAYLWTKDADRRTQQWSIKKVGDAYQFINRASGLALNAPNGDLNTQLNIVQPNADDDAQLWNIVLASDEASYYNIINKKYTRTANVSGGSSDAGTKLINWESNEKNRTSLNRQWIIMPDDFNSDEVWDVGDITENLQTEISKYEQLMAAETVGTAPGQVSKASMNKLTAIINEAKGVMEQGKLNKNLMHTYIYYMERAWKAVEDSRVVLIPINFEAEGNYHLLSTADGADKATASAAFAENNDTPWGYYRYVVGDGTYEKFTTFDDKNSKAKAANGNSWYTNSEYVFLSENGNCHSLPAASPAVMFTAPADGIYFATVTIHRDKAGVNTPLYLRSRYLDGEKKCSKDSYIFAKGYGTPDFDDQDGQGLQTLDFYIRMKQGTSFTFEIENYTPNTDASGRSYITDLAVASCRDKDLPFTIAEAKAYDRFYDAIASEPINFDIEGNYKLFSTAEGASTATADASFAENNDTPWGFYRYTVEDGTYEKFTNYDNQGSNGTAAERGIAWYSEKEYCFVSNTGHYHATVNHSPAVVFTAPEDGIYFATVTVFRDQSGYKNPLYLRSRYFEGEMKCAKEDYIFAKAYGTKDIDEVDGKVPQTLDFFIRMKQGTHFTIETEAYTAASNEKGRTHITSLAVATCRDKDKPFTLEDAEAYVRFFDAAGDPEPEPIDFDAEGNYHLFKTAEGESRATADAAFAKNDDTPWGFYRYTPADGKYTRFAKFDTNNSKAKSSNGTAWYTNDEYCFVTEKGNIHPLASGDKQASPAIAFTAPADGIYFATMTVSRDKNNQENTLNMRSRCPNNKFKCPQESYIFEQAYGTTAIDEVDGKQPQTLDFFIKLKKGQTFTFEIDATSDSGGRSNIADLAVASCRNAEIPFTEEEAKAYERYFDATEAIVDEYTLSYVVDGEVYKSADLTAGTAITPEAAPEKEGYTFSGWSEVPETMPAEDVTVTGSFTVNKYKVRYYVGEQLIAEDEVEFGAVLTLREYTPEDAARYSFVGWEGETYQTMPAHDIEYHAVIADGIGNLNADAKDAPAIRDLSGRKVNTAGNLPRGIYILQGRKVVR